MVDAQILTQILSIRNGVWVAAALVALGVIRLWHALPAIMERLNERRRDRAAIEGDQYERMDARLQRLEQSEEECQHKLVDALRRIAELEGYNIGQGMARQEAAVIVATERIAGAIDKKNGDKGGNGK